MKYHGLWLFALTLLSFLVKHVYPIICYGQRTGSPTSENFGRTIQCPKSISTCVTGIGSIGKPGRTKKFVILGRTCFSSKKSDMFCKNETTSPCQRIIKSDGSILEFCYRCCNTDLCNTYVPSGIDIGDVKKPRKSSKSRKGDSHKKRALLIIRRKEKERPLSTPHLQTTQRPILNENSLLPQVASAEVQNSTKFQKNRSAMTTEFTLIDIMDSGTIEKPGKPSWISNQNISIHKLECRDDRMIVHLNTRYLSENFLINLQDPNCKYYANYLNIVQHRLRLSIEYRSCGTIVQKTYTHTMYTNHIIIKPAAGSEAEKGKKGAYNLSVTCKHKHYQDTNTATGTPTKTESGVHSLFILLYKKSTYQESYQPGDFPIRMKYSSWIFGEIKLDSENKNLILGAIDCYLKTHGSISKKFEVIQNTLPVNRSVRVTNTSATFVRFRLQLSSFMKRNERAHLTCTTHPVCNIEDCKHKKSVKEEVEFFTLTTGYIDATGDVKAERSQSHEVTIAKDKQKYITLGAALGVIFLMAVMCIVINKRNWSTKIKQESETDDTDSQPERSPLANVEAVTDGEKPGYSGGIKA